ncbi:MAG: hypothetical protein H7066_14150 [Cytophagaceae bacterium]|nr:hypothetical protein [Gemmatimonadaceae bacterium]
MRLLAKLACHWNVVLGLMAVMSIPACEGSSDRLRVECTPRFTAASADVPSGYRSVISNHLVGASFDGSALAGGCSALLFDRDGRPGDFSASDQYRWTASMGSQSLEDAIDVYGISADGTTIIGAARVSPNPSGTRAPFEGARWTQGSGKLAFDKLPNYAYSLPTDLSADGSVVVGILATYDPFELDALSRSFRWTREAGMIEVGPLPLGIGAHAEFVSADGRVVVGLLSGDPPGASSPPRGTFVWTEGTEMLVLNELGARAVNADGTAVVGYSLLGDNGAMLWTAASGVSSIGSLPGDGSAQGVAVSADGTIVAGISRAGTQPGADRVFRWTKSTGMIDVADGIAFSVARVCMSSNGAIVVSSDAVSGYSVIWDQVRGARRRPLPEFLCVTGDGKHGIQYFAQGQSVSVGPLP